MQDTLEMISWKDTLAFNWPTVWLW